MPGQGDTARTATSRRLLAQLVGADRIGPVLVVGLVLAALIGARLVTYGGDPTGFVVFGRAGAPLTKPPAGARVATFAGYDGQYFWMQAGDPFLRGRALRGLTSLGTEFRAQRVAYPALAGGLAAGSRAALPWTLLLVNVAAVVALTAAAARFARAEGRSGWWALALGLSPGVVLATLRDLSDPLAVCALAGGLMAWRRDGRALAAGLLALAVLTRETMMLGVVAVAAEGALGAWPHRARGTGERSATRSAIRRTVPVVAVPAAVFLAWQWYVTSRFGGVLPASTMPPGQFGPPFDWLAIAVRRALDAPSLSSGTWDIVYLALVVAAIAAAAVLVVRRRPTASAIAALLFAAVTVLFESDGDKWGYTRATAPLLLTLALGALIARERIALALCGAAAALTLAIPLAFAAASGA